MCNLRENGVPKGAALRCAVSPVHGGVPSVDGCVLSEVLVRSGGKGFEDVDVVPGNSVSSGERVVSRGGLDSV